MAVTKHYALNQQETHRESASSVVDDATKWQLYYPPFEATVGLGFGLGSESGARTLNPTLTLALTLNPDPNPKP